MAYTRSQLRDLVRQRLGWSATDVFVTDTELNNYLNDALLELHSLLATVFRPGQWGASNATLTIGAGLNFNVLTSITDFGRLLNVTMLYGSEFVPMQPGDPIVDIVMSLSTTWTPWNVKYYLRVGGTTPSAMALFFSRPTTASQDVVVNYLKAPAQLSGDSDTSWMGFDEYVLLDAMVKCREKEEADPSGAKQQKEAFIARIRAQAEPLDMGRAATVQDARSLESMRGNADSMWWWRGV